MLWLISLLFVVPLIGLIIFCVLSSCLGDSLRRARPSYGRTYLSSISSGAWENVEMHGIERESDTDMSSDEDGGPIQLH